MERWKGVGKRWTLKTAQNVGTVSLLKMNLQQKAELAQFYFNQLNLRVNTYTPSEIPFAFTQLLHSFEKASNSPKLDPLQQRISLETPIVTAKGRYRELNYPFSEMDNPNASLNNYIRRMQSFFGAKTSTISGWREVAKKQDIALFGAEQGTKYHYVIDENGKRHRVYEMIPKYTLTDSERRQLWKIIDMAKDLGWLNRFGYDSGQAHKELASLWMRGELKNPEEDLEAAYASIVAAIKRKEEGSGFKDEVPGIKGNPIHRNAENGGDMLAWESGQPDLLSQDDTLF